MITCKRVFALGGCMLLGAASVVQADATQGSDVSAELSAMRARIAQLEGQQNQSWLNERRAEEVKSLVREVLSDADTRASMADGGLTAGYNNGFFLASEDGRFLLQIAGQAQFRYTYGAREGTTVGDKNDGEFSIPRTKLFFDGHIGSPKIMYHIQVAANSGGDDLDLEEMLLSYEIADGLTIYGGQKKAPLVRGDIMDSRYLLAADRGFFEWFYTPGRVEGVGLVWDATDAIRTEVMLTDTAGSEFGVIARADFKIAGEWEQINDFSAWSGEGQSMVAGISGRYVEGAHGVGNGFNYTTTGVLDISYENNGLGLYAAGAASNSKSSAGGNYQTYGITLQGNIFVVPDKFELFARYDYINLTDSATGDPSIATAGFNYYLAKHAAKFTVDVQFGLRSVEFAPGLSGLLTDIPDNRNQTVVRGQFQLLF